MLANHGELAESNRAQADFPVTHVRRFAAGGPGARPSRLRQERRGNARCPAAVAGRPRRERSRRPGRGLGSGRIAGFRCPSRTAGEGRRGGAAGQQRVGRPIAAGRRRRGPALAGTAEGNYACRYHALSSRRMPTPAAAVAWKGREDQPSIAARSNSDGSRERCPLPGRRSWGSSWTLMPACCSTRRCV